MIIMSIELFGLENIPIVDGNSDISLIIKDAINKQGCNLNHGDIVLIAETLISKAEENFIRLDDLTPSSEAIKLAEESGKDPKLVQAILDESSEVVRVGSNFIITETKHGFVCANAGIDESNVGDGLATPMPEDADKSAREIREFLEDEFNQEIAVIITDTQGRAFRFGAIGTAIGCSGISPIWKRVGEKDLYGRELETTEIATCDELSAAASLIMGQADEGLPVVIVRGFDSFDILRNTDSNIKSVLMPKKADVFRK
ncbi:coenzyme F420-0:L-glutamate ligase [Methanobrevibacter sp.]